MVTTRKRRLAPRLASDVPPLARLAKSLYRSRYLQLLMLPGLAFFIIFRYVPMYGVIIAFKDFRVARGILGSRWVGFENFERFITYPYFARLFLNTLTLNIYDVLVGFWPPILLALFLNEVRSVVFKKAVQTVSYLPHMISTVSIVGMLVLVTSPQGGMINVILERVFGIQPIYFLGEARWFRPLFIGSGIWQNAGWGAIVYLAALSAVDQEMYEAATIDGASRVQKMLRISIPAIAPTIIIMLILRVGRMMNDNVQKILLMQNPLTYAVSDVIGTFEYRRGLQQAEYSFGAAIGLFQAAINLIIVTLANAVSRRVSESSLW